MSLHSSSPEIRIADQIVASAIAHLNERFSGRAAERVSAGILGSYARRDLCATSDLDFYVIFDSTAFTSTVVEMNEERMSQIVCGLSEHVIGCYPQEPLARRFSVFWTTLESLRTGRLEIGRWPAYDRLALLNEGVHRWGNPTFHRNLATISRSTLVHESARFLLGVVKEKVGVLLLERISLLDEVALEALGPVLLTKAATMPARLLHTLKQREAHLRTVSTERAAREISGSFGQKRWWSLVEAGLVWRNAPPRNTAEWRSAAGLVRSCALEMYVDCATAYEKELERMGSHHLASTVRNWRETLHTELESRARPQVRVECGS